MRCAGFGLLILVLTGCGSSADGQTTLDGTVVFLEQHGGIYGLLGDDGGAYEPGNLPPEFEVDGLRVRFEARPVDGAGRWGDPVEILEIDFSNLPPPGRLVELEGTVVWIDLEGGFFGIVADDGEHYDPIDLPAAFARDGLRVRVVARIRRDLASAHMWAELIDIERIEALP